MLRQVKAELPNFISNVYLLDLAGIVIGTSAKVIERPYLGDRGYFQQALAGQRLVIGKVVRSRFTGEWVMAVAHRVEDQAGRLLAVLVVGTKL